METERLLEAKINLFTEPRQRPSTAANNRSNSNQAQIAHAAQNLLQKHRQNKMLRSGQNRKSSQKQFITLNP
jgi:hypothetical protein